MKKIVFALLGFSSLMVLSCRQQEEMLDSEDLKSLSVLQEAKNKVNSNLKQRTSNLISEKDSTLIIKKNISTRLESFQEMEMDSDPIRPPR